ncbi:hypothetical protein Y032_0081g1491 [Ancylostoma ceylanicum]|uniref:WAP domain-containing protein n=1 Tax=Ancylostoma ceylanicum TaxID=53326 RepID=A0A016TTD4_9BILA|nr:hypothetical protein Y032_0081g1491 [Ancylostoma ceylanicum]
MRSTLLLLFLLFCVLSTVDAFFGCSENGERCPRPRICYRNMCVVPPRGKRASGPGCEPGSPDCFSPRR